MIENARDEFQLLVNFCRLSHTYIVEEKESTVNPITSQIPDVKPHRQSLKLPVLLLAVAAIIILIASPIYLYTLIKDQKKPIPVSKSQIIAVNQPSAEFAQYKEVKSIVTPALKPYVLKSAELINLKAVGTDAKIKFDTAKLSALETTGFFTQPTQPTSSDPEAVLNLHMGRSDDMVDLYSKFSGNTVMWERKPENAIFVTTDFLMHIFHVLIDRSFQKTEEVNFQPALKQLTEVLFKDVLQKYNSENDPVLKESWKRLAAYYLVPQAILNSAGKNTMSYFESPEAEAKAIQDDKTADSIENVTKKLQEFQNSTPPEIYSLAGAELDLVMKAKDFGIPSPLLGALKPNSKEDYTQFAPRSHYNKNSILRTYFRAMMWYGRIGFDLKSPDLTRDGLLATYQLLQNKVNGKPALEIWEKIYLPTIFFVGKSDDLTIYDYADLITKVYGKSVETRDFADNAKLEKLQIEAQKLQGPKILSEIKVYSDGNVPTKEDLLKSTKGFRFMGQRFIPDSYYLASLTQGDEPADPEIGQKLPSTPTGLMVMSLLGSKTADNLLDDWVKTNAPDSDRVIAKFKGKLTAEIQQYDEKTWTQNIYWSWLYNLRTLFADHTDGYPMFMRGIGWAKKSLLSAFGSWTELRHDTLLYAKQSYAELGGGGDQQTPPPVPKGYVEPNLSFLTRLIALTTQTRDGLDSRGLLVPGQKEKFDSYLESLQFFKSIAEKELTDAVITDEDYEKLRNIIKLDYPDIVWTPDGGTMTEADARMGIVADVHSDAKKGQILYEATGAPSVIYVAVKDKNGTRLTRGVTYSYYEFTRPAGGTRMNDQDWQGMIYDGKNTGEIPPVPAWTKELIKP